MKGSAQFGVVQPLTNSVQCIFGETDFNHPLWQPSIGMAGADSIQLASQGQPKFVDVIGLTRLRKLSDSVAPALC